MKEGKIRFNTVFVSDKVPSDAKIVELKEWSEKFQKNGLTPVVEGNYTGNLSFRLKDGFVITASGLKNKENLADNCFVNVKAYDEKANTFFVEGKKKPSSESIMHHLLYKANKEINAVFHGHNDNIVSHAEKMSLPITETEYESGTIELAKEVLKVMGNKELIVIRNHGFVSLGKNMKKAGELALHTLNQTKTSNLDSAHT
ncbi:MAG: class II aldolase/adducin family protein [Candidatus Bathyarchaeota archaeon]|nr:class II aldolase/adducin family protein [Candidatus Bathyarchaeum sp.]